MLKCPVCRARKAEEKIREAKRNKLPDRLLYIRYREMVVRSKKRNHPMALSFEKFKKWAINSDTFWDMYSKWKKAGYPIRLSPTINRKDNTKGYVLKNMEWKTLSENSSLGTQYRWKSKSIK